MVFETALHSQFHIPDSGLLPYSSEIALNDLKNHIGMRLSNPTIQLDQIPIDNLRKFLNNMDNLQLFISELKPEDIIFIVESAIHHLDLGYCPSQIEIYDHSQSARKYDFQNEIEKDEFYRYLRIKLGMRLNKLNIDSKPGIEILQQETDCLYTDEQLFNFISTDYPVEDNPTEILDVMAPDRTFDPILGTMKENSIKLVTRSLNFFGVLPYSNEWLRTHFTQALEEFPREIPVAKKAEIIKA